MLVEQRLGPLRLFVNFKNLTDVRQHRWDPVLRPDRAPTAAGLSTPRRSFDGRVVNGGVRVQF